MSETNLLFCFKPSFMKERSNHFIFVVFGRRDSPEPRQDVLAEGLLPGERGGAGGEWVSEGLDTSPVVPCRPPLTITLIKTVGHKLNFCITR